MREHLAEKLKASRENKYLTKSLKATFMTKIYNRTNASKTHNCCGYHVWKKKKITEQKQLFISSYINKYINVLMHSVVPFISSFSSFMYTLVRKIALPFDSWAVFVCFFIIFVTICYGKNAIVVSEWTACLCKYINFMWWNMLARLTRILNSVLNNK